MEIGAGGEIRGSGDVAMRKGRGARPERERGRPVAAAGSVQWVGGA